MERCPICGKFFRTYRGMRTHFRKAHPVEYKEERLKEIVKKEWKVPAEIADYIDFHSYATKEETINEILQSIVRDYGLDKYARPVEEEDIDLMIEEFEREKKYAMIQDLEKLIEDYGFSKEEMREILKELIGEEEEEKRIKELEEKITKISLGEIEKRMKELEEKMKELERKRKEIELEEELKREREKEKVTELEPTLEEFISALKRRGAKLADLPDMIKTLREIEKKSIEKKVEEHIRKLLRKGIPAAEIKYIPEVVERIAEEEKTLKELCESCLTYGTETEIECPSCRVNAILEGLLGEIEIATLKAWGDIYCCPSCKRLFNKNFDVIWYPSPKEEEKPPTLEQIYDTCIEFGRETEKSCYACEIYKRQGTQKEIGKWKKYGRYYCCPICKQLFEVVDENVLPEVVFKKE